MYQVGNVYVIAAVAVVGGALFGFDISSMSAIISTKAYLCYFNQGPYYWEIDGKCSGPTPDVQGMIRSLLSSGNSTELRNRWYHGCHAWWVLVRCFSLRVSFRYPRQKKGNPNRIYNLVCCLYDRSALSFTNSGLGALVPSSSAPLKISPC